MTTLRAESSASLTSAAAGVRLRYLLLAGVTIAIGLAVHAGPLPLGPRLRDATGDGLWAVMMVWWIGVALPFTRPVIRAALALAVCFAVEFSQLYRVAWLDAIRATRPGQLVLGSGFDARDLAAYALGVLVAFGIDRLLHRAAPIGEP